MSKGWASNCWIQMRRGWLVDGIKWRRELLQPGDPDGHCRQSTVLSKAATYFSLWSHRNPFFLYLFVSYLFMLLLFLSLSFFAIVIVILSLHIYTSLSSSDCPTTYQLSPPISCYISSLSISPFET